MQWGEADNENTAKQKTDQAKCEEMWTSLFLNPRQSWCKLGKSSSLHSGSLKNSVQNRNKTNEHMTISIRRKILEKLIWKDQKTVLFWCSRAAGNRLWGAIWAARGGTDPKIWQPWAEPRQICLYLSAHTYFLYGSYIPILQKVILYGERR